MNLGGEPNQRGNDPRRLSMETGGPSALSRVLRGVRAAPRTALDFGRGIGARPRLHEGCSRPPFLQRRRDRLQVGRIMRVICPGGFGVEEATRRTHGRRRICRSVATTIAVIFAKIENTLFTWDSLTWP